MTHPRPRPSRLATFAVLALLAPAAALAQDEAPGDKPDEKPAKKSDNAIKPYDEVITEDAVTCHGLFHVHRLDDKLFYEIPTGALDLDMLWVTQIAQTTAGSSHAGMPAGNRVVRWEQRGERILFRDVRYSIRADTDDPIAGAVAATNLAPIIRVFPVKAYGKDKAPVIDVTALFTNDVPELSAKRSLGAAGMDEKRSFIESVKCFPRNLETRVLATYTKKDDERTSGLTAMIHHSMVMLPEDPMQPRRADARVGFFSVGFTDYADDSNHEAEPVRYITRWRLAKKNPDDETSDPVKPIVFYVGRGVPEKWKPYVKAGIEQWQPAFEAAGFTNAIIGKLAPDPRDDPDWDAEDARVSTIRWLPADIKNAFGPHVNDPRTGEILEADVRMFHNVHEAGARLVLRPGGAAVDPRAQKLPMPDDLMGELIRLRG